MGCKKNRETNLNQNHVAWEKYWKMFYDSLKQKFSREDDLIVGDKNPYYYHFYGQLTENFQEVQFIFIIRNVKDVALSYDARANNLKDTTWPKNKNYQKAVSEWNDSLLKTWNYLENSNNHEKLWVCQYEKLFSFDPAYLKEMMNFLKVDVHQTMYNHYEQATQNWGDRVRRQKTLTSVESEYIEKFARFDLQNRIIEKYGS